MGRKNISIVFVGNILCCEGSLFSIRLHKRDSVIIVLQEMKNV